MPTLSELNSMAAVEAEFAAQAAELRNTPAPAAPPELKTFASPPPAGTPGEVHVQDAIKFQKQLATDYRALGRTEEADKILADLDGYVSKLRIDLGVPAPAVPDATVAAAREYGVELQATPELYRKARVELPHVTENSAARAEHVKVEMAELMASMGLNENDGALLIEQLARETPRVSMMSEAERIAWVREQERIASDMATRRGSSLKEWKDEAAKQLQGTPLGRRMAQTFALSNAALLAILADARAGRKAFEKSRKR